MKQKVQDPLHATMLGLKRVINNAPLVQQPPPHLPARHQAKYFTWTKSGAQEYHEGLTGLHLTDQKPKFTHLLEWLTFFKLITSSPAEGLGLGLPQTQCWWEGHVVEPPRKTAWRFPIKLNIHKPYDPASPLQGIQVK